jgi:hypothetical protein
MSRLSFTAAMREPLAVLASGGSLGTAAKRFREVANSTVAVGAVESDPVGGTVPTGFRPSSFAVDTVGMRTGTGPRGERTVGGLKETRAAYNSEYLPKPVPQPVAEAAQAVVSALDTLSEALRLWIVEPQPEPEPEPQPTPKRSRSRSR